MSQPPELTRIRIEDFKPEEQEMVGKLSGSINRFFEQVTNLFTKNVDFDNLNRQIIKVQVQIDGSGNVINNPQAKFTLRANRVQGLTVISATNDNDLTIYPTSAPFVSYTFNNGIITIQNVSGLQINSSYTLTLELIG